MWNCIEWHQCGTDWNTHPVRVSDAASRWLLAVTTIRSTHLPAFNDHAQPKWGCVVWSGFALIQVTTCKMLKHVDRWPPVAGRSSSRLLRNYFEVGGHEAPDWKRWQLFVHKARAIHGPSVHERGVPPWVLIWQKLGRKRRRKTLRANGRLTCQWECPAWPVTGTS